MLIENTSSFINKKWQTYLIKIIKNDLFLILIISGIVRLAFYLNLENTDGWFPDSNSYLNYSANLLLGQVDILRTPIYPYFIKLIKLFGEEHLTNIKIVQCIISFLAIILFYKMARSVFQNRTAILLSTLVYAITPSIINFDVCVLTESLSLSGIVLFLYFIVSYLNQPQKSKAILSTFLVLILVMLRPSFIYLLPIILLFWLLRIMVHKIDWRISIYGMGTSFVCILLIFGYSKLNFKNNDFNGISIVTNINALSNIIQFNMYMNGNDPEISEKIERNVRMGDHRNVASLSNYSSTRIQKFINNSILNDPLIYVKGYLLRILSIANTTTLSVLTNYKNGLFGLPDLYSNIFTIRFLCLYLLMFFDIIFIIINWVKYHNILWFKIIVWLIIAAQVAVAIYGESEHQRLFAIALPCTIVLIFYYIDMILFSIDTKKLILYIKHSFDNTL